HTFYEEGLIPTDFLSIETEEFQKIMSSDTSFITQDYISRIDMFNIPLRQENPDYTLIHMPPPAGFPDGDQLDYSNHTAKGGYLVPKDSDHIETALRYIDWTFSEEGRDTLSWGVEEE